MAEAEESRNRPGNMTVLEGSTSIPPIGDKSDLPTDIKTIRGKPPMGVVYIARIPPKWNRSMILRYFGKFGEVTRLFLNKRATHTTQGYEQRRNLRSFVFTDGWIEFKSARLAKKVVRLMDGQPIGGKKRSKHSQDLLMLSYLKDFDFSSLYDDAMHLKRTRQERLTVQLEKAKKENAMYMELFDYKRQIDHAAQRKAADEPNMDNTLESNKISELTDCTGRHIRGKRHKGSDLLANDSTNFRGPMVQASGASLSVLNKFVG